MAINLLVQTATELGCILDCNLATGAKIGGGTPTDNTAIINAFLALSSATTAVKLIMDGPSACTGIKILNGNVTIEGIGLSSGFYINTGSNNHVISTEAGSNGSGFPPFDPATTPPTQLTNIILRDFYINGNRGTGFNGDSTSGDPRGISGTVFYCGLDLINVNGLLIDNVWIYNAASYGMRLGNVTNFTIRDCNVSAPSGAVNTDTIHIDGPASFGVITGCVLQLSGDDGIALNAPEGYGGNISDIAISNCLFNGTSSAVRCYTVISTQYSVSEVTIGNCTGTVGRAAFLLGNSGSAADAVHNWKVSNCSFVVGTSFIEFADSCGDIALYGCTWHSPSTADPFVSFVVAVTVSSLTLDHCKIYRSTGGSSAAFGLASTAASTITKLNLDLSIENEASESYAAIANLLEMTDMAIGLLWISALDSTYVTALADSFTNITKIDGPGVLSSGQQIPDANMSNLCPYISATSPHAGVPCIVVSGTPKVYTIV